MFLPAIQAVIKQAIFPFIIDLSISLANFGLISGAADVRLPKLIPRAATLPKPHNTYVAITAVLPCKKKWCTCKYKEAQRLSARVLDTRSRGRFEPQRRHCVVSLSRTH